MSNQKTSNPPAASAAGAGGLSAREWVILIALTLVIGGGVSFAALYQAFKIGYFLTGGMASSMLAWGFIRYVVRQNPARAGHMANYVQTACSSMGATTGMGSMLLALGWATGQQPTGLQVALLALPSSLFGVAAANWFAANWLNVQRLTYPSGVATGVLLQSLAQGGKVVRLLGLGAAIAATVFVLKDSKSTLTLVAVGVGWILGWEVIGWALLAALTLQHFEPAMKAASLIQSGGYRDVSIYLGACVIIAAGVVDIGFALFAKKTEGENPEFREVQGLMSRRANAGFLLGTAGAMALVMWWVFSLPPHVTLGISGLLLVLVWVIGTCLGKTGQAPVSALSGLVILLTGAFGPWGSLLYGAAAGQVLVNGVDQIDDYRTGERVGSNFPTQRAFQIFGTCVGASLCLGAMYALLTNAYSENLTLAAVKAKDAPFSCGFALKYYGFLSLREKLTGAVGTVCLWTLGLTVVVQLAKNVLDRTGWKRLSRLIPSAYAAALACFVSIEVVGQQAAGAGLAVLGLVIWQVMGTPITNPVTQKAEPAIRGLPWSQIIGLPVGLIVGESLCGFIAALWKIFG